MSLRSILLTTAFFLALPLTASAMQTASWDFTNAKLAPEWQVKSWTTVTPTQEGLHIQTNQEGYLFRATGVSFGIDGFTVDASAAKPVTALLIWHNPGTPDNQIYQFPFTVANADPLFIDLTLISVWTGHPDAVGMALPAGSDVMIRSITPTGWNIGEKALAVWRSFWMTDGFSNTTINFLWGPLLRFTPVTREALFAGSPPYGWSANRILLVFLLLAAAAALICRWRRGWSDSQSKRSALNVFLLCALGLWLLFDLRMGLEIFQYVRDDRATLAKPPFQRNIRNFSDFYDVLGQSLPTLRKVGVFGFLLPSGDPMGSRVQYAAYPSLLATPDIIAKGYIPRAWLIYNRPDITVDAKGVLRDSAGIIASSGSITERYNAASFLYVLKP